MKKKSIPFKIVVALDSFKESASALDASRWVAQGIETGLPPGFFIQPLPVCDGGTGFSKLVAHYRDGYIHNNISAYNACMQPLNDAFYTSFVDEKGMKTAVIESADTIGLARIGRNADENPKCRLIERSSYGLGVILKTAAECGFDKIVVGFGDSAVQDAGVGLLEALGADFIDRRGKKLNNISTQDLGKIKKIYFEKPDCFKQVKIEMACNLSSLLSNTVQKYAVQKGATEYERKKLLKWTKSIAGVFDETWGMDIFQYPGSGASGGTGAAFIAALNAVPRYSFNVVDEILNISGALSGADFVVVGEGKMDSGTARGKACGATAMRAALGGAIVLAVSGSVEKDSYGSLARIGIRIMQTLSDPSQGLESYLNKKNARRLLKEAGMRLSETIRIICDKRVSI